MEQFIYGPIPSRRLGLSLGISPIPAKHCNYSCVYCQLGRTNHCTNKRELYFFVAEILAELDEVLRQNLAFDVISIVGDGEPTLYLGLGDLISELKKRTDKPLALITNGALLTDATVCEQLQQVDILLPSLDGYDEESFRLINRPHKRISFSEVFEALSAFSHSFQGQLWLEIMLMAGLNDSEAAFLSYRKLIQQCKYDRLYLNTPIRPPAEKNIKPIDQKKMALKSWEEYPLILVICPVFKVVLLMITQLS